MKILLLLGLFILSNIASYILAMIWWHLWMYHGAFAAPDFLRPFLEWDGERAYDRALLEMFLTVWVPMVVLMVVFFLKKVVVTSQTVR